MPVKIIPFRMSPVTASGEPCHPGGRHILTERVVKNSWEPRRPHGAYEIVRVVAVEGAVNDWCAYYGPIGWSPQIVQENGIKLMEEDAARLFPFLKIERYRR